MAIGGNTTTSAISSTTIAAERELVEPRRPGGGGVAGTAFAGEHRDHAPADRGHDEQHDVEPDLQAGARRPPSTPASARCTATGNAREQRRAARPEERLRRLPVRPAARDRHRHRDGKCRDVHGAPATGQGDVISTRPAIHKTASAASGAPVGVAGRSSCARQSAGSRRSPPSRIRTASRCHVTLGRVNIGEGQRAGILQGPERRPTVRQTGLPSR